MIASNRDEFVQKCLRRIGGGVIDINVDWESIDDAVDYSLKYYIDYHYDGTHRTFYKHQLKQNNFPRSIYHLQLNEPGIGYSNTDTVIFDIDGGGEAHIITDNAGSITEVVLTENGKNYPDTPKVSIQSSTGSGAKITAELGGWIEIPQNIIGAVRIFELGTAISSANLFSMQFQYVINELWAFSSSGSMIPYYLNMQYVNLIQQMLIGYQPIRYNRHRNRLHIDMNWNRVVPEEWLIVEAFEMVDPDIFTDVWDDRWLIQYCSAQIQRVWGKILTKYRGSELAGNMTVNGEQILKDAEDEIRRLEDDLHNRIALPPMFITG